MKVVKFGGSSLANAECFDRVVAILNEALQDSQLATVVSAPQGITNDLVALIVTLTTHADKAHTAKHHADHYQRLIENKLSKIIDESLENFPGVWTQSQVLDSLKTGFEEIVVRLNQLVQGAKLLAHCPEQTQAQILSCGEKFSVLLLSHWLKAARFPVTEIDPECFLTTQEHSAEPVANLELSKQIFNQCYPKLERASVMPGFFGVKANGETTTLGRNGSDYSAAILAVCLDADICEIWTDVDGVYNADPRLVKEAQLIDKMSYHEAMELSYFGAKVLHPKTIAPLAQNHIPCLIKNTHAPHKPGTLISNETSPHEMVKAISNLSDVAMLNVSGAGMKGMVGMASRVFSAISRANISVIMISQSSSEYCISFCVPGSEVNAAKKCLEREFELEINHERLDPIEVKTDLAVITLVGDHMQQQKGIAAKFFTALAQARVNIIAIAQDASERSISAVIRDERTDDAIKVCHQNLFLKRPSIDLILIGCGTIGKQLIGQIAKQKDWLGDKHIKLNLVGIANSRQLLVNPNGVDLGNWQQALAASRQSLNLETLNRLLSDGHLTNPVLVDCTSSEQIAMQYLDYLNAGFHLVTANKKANTASWHYYAELRRVAQHRQRRFLYETNVGAGLPVIDNLQGLLRAGDQLVQFEGILSGSLSFIFSELSCGKTLSEATAEARARGYTEPNPAEDLSGLDVARKVLVIAREAGLELELDDIHLEPVIPEALAKINDADEFMRKLASLDADFAKKVAAASSEQKLLRYVATIEAGQCRVEIKAIGPEHPFYSVGNGENALALHTRYYQPKPLVIRGYGAGAEVTAAGLFGDILRTLAWDQVY